MTCSQDPHYEGTWGWLKIFFCLYHVAALEFALSNWSHHPLDGWCVAIQQPSVIPKSGHHMIQSTFRHREALDITINRLSLSKTANIGLVTGIPLSLALSTNCIARFLNLRVLGPYFNEFLLIEIVWNVADCIFQIPNLITQIPKYSANLTPATSYRQGYLPLWLTWHTLFNHLNTVLDRQWLTLSSHHETEFLRKKIFHSHEVSIEKRFKITCSCSHCLMQKETMIRVH